jgi:hypothetical protein
MNINDFIEERHNLILNRQRDFVNRALNELTKKVNQEYSRDEKSEVFDSHLLPFLKELEDKGFFGEGGFNG